MKLYISLVLLLELLAACTHAQHDASGYTPVQVINVTMEDSSLAYPDILLLLPQDMPVAQRAELMDQLGVEEGSGDGEPPDNALGDPDVTEGARAALLQAARLVVASLSNSTDETGFNNASHVVYTVSPTLEEESIRKRRSLQRLAPLNRTKRTLKKSKHSCMVCQLLQPKQPIVINVYKPGGCGGGCGQHYQPPPPCGHPQCGYHPPPQPQPVYHQPQPVYHPPPRPQPVYHPPPQTCDPCHQPTHQQPAGNSWSYSQSSSSASSGSYGGWGKKK